MGIPGCFVKYTRKYPETIRKEKLQMIDSMYIDYNCGIHPCCRERASKGYQHNRQEICEKHMIQDCIEYLMKLIAYARPRRLIHVVIDGVAPRAKMMQQRYRRFKNDETDIKMMEQIFENENGYINTNQTNQTKNELKPEFKDEKWDTNAITPGTVFMDKLAEAIRNYVKTSNNPQLQSLIFIFSDSNQPGEGEHKILEYLRNHSNEITPGENIIIYGLDADLMMLSMVSHINQIYLLRESIEFGKEFASETVQFCYLDIDLLKFSILNDLKDRIPYDMDMNQQIQLVDDYVFLCFMIGNDFIPNLPPLNIKEGGLDILVDVYTSAFTNLTKVKKKYGWTRDSNAFSGDGISTGTEMTEGAWKMDKSNYSEEFEFQFLVDIQNCKINFDFLGKILNKLSHMEDNLMAEFESRRARMKPRMGICKDDSERKKAQLNNYPIYMRIKKNSAEARIDIRNPDHQWRRRYYKETMHMQPTQSNIDEVCFKYLQGLVWVLTYYYKGCDSWSWYYPHHHAPSIYDLNNFIANPEKWKSLKLVKGKPYKPFEQLMLVLPFKSRHLLPKGARSLMTSQSPIAQYYPEQYEVDPIFRRFYWQCSPILPPIDDKEVKNELAKKKLTTEEQHRNRTTGATIFIGSKVSNNFEK